MGLAYRAERARLHLVLNIVQSANVLRSVEAGQGIIRLGGIRVPNPAPFMDVRVRNQVVTGCSPGLFYEVRRWNRWRRLRWAGQALFTTSVEPPSPPTSLAIIQNVLANCHGPGAEVMAETPEPPNSPDPVAAMAMVSPDE